MFKRYRNKSMLFWSWMTYFKKCKGAEIDDEPRRLPHLLHRPPVRPCHTIGRAAEVPVPLPHRAASVPLLYPPHVPFWSRCPSFSGHWPVLSPFLCIRTCPCIFPYLILQLSGLMHPFKKTFRLQAGELLLLCILYIHLFFRTLILYTF